MAKSYTEATDTRPARCRGFGAVKGNGHFTACVAPGELPKLPKMTSPKPGTVAWTKLAAKVAEGQRSYAA